MFKKLKAVRNKVSIEIAELKKKGKMAKSKIIEMKGISEDIKKKDDQIKKLEKEVIGTLLIIPNLPNEKVPIGGEESNMIISEHGKKPKKKVLTHWEIGQKLDILDLERSAKIAGAGFYILKGKGAQLQRALINYFLDFHSKKGYTEILPPILVNRESAIGTGHLPKFEEDMYRTQDDMFLIPTGELPLTNMHAKEFLTIEELPKKYCAFTPCFRVEAGRHGTATRGIFRLHQFDKVEMVNICHPDDSWNLFEEMREAGEELLKELGIPYRVVLLATEDLGQAAAQTYDLEVWSPALNKYLECSSVSNCTDYQARRNKTKIKTKEGNINAHTLNGSGLALPRLMISILENYQNSDGSIDVPKVLHKYTGFKKIK